MKRTTAVAVSGGVDSMIAAHILKPDDPNVFGLHFLTGFEPPPADGGSISAKSIGERLDMPVHVVDVSADFKRCVVDYFSAAYRAGETPNPCMVPSSSSAGRWGSRPITSKRSPRSRRCARSSSARPSTTASPSGHSPASSGPHAIPESARLPGTIERQGG